MYSNNLKFIYNFISFLIKPETSIYRNKLKFILNNLSWEQLVKVSSSHLILPVIYTKLKNKKKQLNPPDDLMLFLEKIYKINLERNRKILHQAKFIGNLFNKHNIKYVFIKGSALIFLKNKDFLKNRMIGDIDILVANDHIIFAKKILIENGFSYNNPKEKNLTEGIKGIESRHLNRLTSKKFISAVELHREVLRDKYYNILPSNQMFFGRYKSEYNIYVPSMKNLWKHAILDWQINDYGYQNNYISFKTLNDVFFLEPENLKNKISSETKEIKHFYNLISVFYQNNLGFKSCKRYFFKAKLEYSFVNKFFLFHNKFKLFSDHIFSRFILLLNSKVYRKRIINNPQEIIKKISKNFKET